MDEVEQATEGPDEGLYVVEKAGAGPEEGGGAAEEEGEEGDEGVAGGGGGDEGGGGADGAGGAAEDKAAAVAAALADMEGDEDEEEEEEEAAAAGQVDKPTSAKQAVEPAGPHPDDTGEEEAELAPAVAPADAHVGLPKRRRKESVEQLHEDKKAAIEAENYAKAKKLKDELAAAAEAEAAHEAAEKLRKQEAAAAAVVVEKGAAPVRFVVDDALVARLNEEKAAAIEAEDFEVSCPPRGEPPSPPTDSTFPNPTPPPTPTRS